MPDLMTHTFLGLLAAKRRSKLKNFEKLFFLLSGNLVPDLFSRAPMILFTEYINFLVPYHTLLGTLVISYLISLLFNENRRYTIFIYLYAGTVFHQLVDLIQKNIFNTGYQIFFPFEFQINIGMIWSEDCIYVLPFLGLITLIVYKKESLIFLKKLRKIFSD